MPWTRLSAPLLLGVYAGSIAALAVLPVVLLAVFSQSLERLEHSFAVAELVATGRAQLGPVLEEGTSFPLAAVDVLLVRSPDGSVKEEKGAFEATHELDAGGELFALCAGQGTTARISVDDQPSYVWGCAAHEDHWFLAAVSPKIVSVPQLLLLMLLITTVVGTLAALVIHRVLSPLNGISRALARVSLGERNVRVETTGFSELDDLIARVNETATAMEDREDEVKGRIRTVQRLARVVAHEVRNPLQSIQIMTSLLVDEPDREERQAAALAIRQEVSNLDQVVARMLKRSIGEDLELKPVPFELGTLLDHLHRLHSARARANGLLLSVETGGALPVVGDSALLGRCLDNLVSNALQYATRQIVVTAGIERGMVRIDVEDDGEGVDPLIADRLFEPNVSQRQGGSGLGLALAYAVVDAHGGAIEVHRSRLGGADFRVLLPPTSPEVR